jgi:hypothetical protein
MAIPESQLETWSKQGSITQSSATYQTIKSALEATAAPYSATDVDVFLQGSYGNDTNIFAESDVDIVIMRPGSFFHDLDELPADQQSAFRSAFSDAVYTYTQFRADVSAVLTKKYGAFVKPGDKAVRIDAGSGRRNADVVTAFEFRRYHKFRSLSDQRYDSGIGFYTNSGVRIANYPKQHSANCTAKHQVTGKRFKPMVRILKNLRGKLIADGVLGQGAAPSYYLEGLLYNVPPEAFGGTYSSALLGALNWIVDADRTKFVCANEQYYLLHKDSPVTWRADNCDSFLAAAVDLWTHW